MDDLADLRVQLQQEQAARQEYEYQSAATTRQLWLLRDKHDREMRQLQDQLSIVRASLILAHKQQHMQLGITKTAQLFTTSDAAEDSPAGDDVADSPKKGRRTPDQARRSTPRQPSRAATPQDVQDAAMTGQQQTLCATSKQAASPLSSQPQVQSIVPVTADTSEAPTASANGSMLQPTSRPACTDSGLHATAATTGMQLLTAAAKLQQIVEQLTQREPAAAADLSVLQWHLTAAYGSLNGASGRRSSSNRSMSHSCELCSSSTESSTAGSGPTAAIEQPELSTMGLATAATSMQVLPGHTDLMPQQLPTTLAAIEQPENSTSGLVTAVTSMQALPGHKDLATQQLPTAVECHNSSVEQHQQRVTDIAAAAMLFSGATSTLQSDKLDWYYMDGSSAKGPYDPALMIRWYCSSYLEGSLPIAGVVQQANHSTDPPPAAAFEPMQSLLDNLQQQGSYAPFGDAHDAPATTTAAASIAASAGVLDYKVPSLPVSTSSGVGDATVAASACEATSTKAQYAGAEQLGLTEQLVVSWNQVMGQHTAAAAAAGPADQPIGACHLSKNSKGGQQQQQQVVEDPCISESQQYSYETALQQKDPLQDKQQAQQQLFEVINDNLQDDCSYVKQHKQNDSTIFQKQQQQQQDQKLQQQLQQDELQDLSSWSIAAVSRAAYAAYDVLEGVGNAVESAVTATVESVINTAESAFAGQLISEDFAPTGLKAESDSESDPESDPESD